MLEFKLFFVGKIACSLSFKEIERILHILEENFFATDLKESLLAH